ncbi:MAG: helix-turn-helix domain-containing protein [Actinomycetota bacterium]|nr:helix-turn-helix domain-containing protein [Actinomycetota bacterium]
MHDAVDAPGVARAGSAFATRREHLGISQRELASKKVISAPALIAFEKGRAWPRERTRALLEEVAQWPAGTLARLRAGGEVPEAGPGAPWTPAPATARDGVGPLVVEAVDVAMNTVTVAIGNLPPPSDPRFAPAARAVLADLRHLEAVTAKAVRSSAGNPAVIRALAAVRRCYDELMATAAVAPGATLGQRLYTARRRCSLSVTEVASALGVPTELVVAVEAERATQQDYLPRIEALIADLLGT